MLTTKYDHAVAKRKQEPERMRPLPVAAVASAPGDGQPGASEEGAEAADAPKARSRSSLKMVARMTVMANRLGKGGAAAEPTPEEEEVFEDGRSFRGSTSGSSFPSPRTTALAGASNSTTARLHLARTSRCARVRILVRGGGE